MRLIGFSTGAFHEFAPPVSREAINICWKLGVEAIEIGCLESDFLDMLLELNRNDFSGFKYISLHAPTKGISYGCNKLATTARDKIYGAHCEIGFDNIILHPNRVEDPGIFAGLNLPISFENTDSRKEKFGCPDDFKALLEYCRRIKGGDKITLDLAHLFDRDSSMSLVGRFFQKFQDKICEIHVSGFDGHHHVPVYMSGQDNIIYSCPTGKTPVIIESVCQNFNQAEKELQHIKSLLAEQPIS